MNDYLCEICGEKASVFCQDITEGEPTVDHWATWKPSGTHYYCKKHYRPSTVTTLDGYTTIDLNAPSAQMRIRWERENKLGHFQ